MATALARLMLPLCAILGLTAGAAAQAQNYPDRPIKMLVGFAAGGSSDVLARVVANALSQRLGQQIVVENRPGVGGHIAAEAVAHATPDGYTILFGTNGTLGIGPAIYKHLRYDPLKDLAPVGLLHKLPLVLIVNPSVPAKNLKELIADAQANPGKLTFASAGVGSVSHLAGELFKAAAKINILHVPYKGGGAAVPDLLAGRVSMMLETIPNALPMSRSGKMRALAVTTAERSAAAPELPTMAESGLPGFDVSAWTALYVPAGTPAAIVQRLNKETQAIAGEPHYVEQIKKMGTDIAKSTPEGLTEFMRKDIASWTQAVTLSGIKKID